jgi:hypothetical protein
MGTFNSSHVLPSWFLDLSANGTASHYYAITADSVKLALYNATPDATIFPYDTPTKNSYNGTSGQWVTANEITGTNWSAGGVALTSVTATTRASTPAELYVSSNSGSFSAASVTISTSFQGCLIYDNTTAAQTGGKGTGIVAIYFGGTYTVGGGTLTINWGNDGNADTCIFYITC